MENPVSEGFRGLLAAHVALSGWELHTGMMPKSPAKIIMLSDTGGLEPNPRWLLDFPSAQAMIRGEVGGYLATHKEASAVKDILLGIPSQTIANDRWVAINLGSDVAFLGLDEKEHPLFSINFRLIIEPQATANTNRSPL